MRKSLASNILQEGSLSFHMPSYVWPHAVFPLPPSKTHSSTPIYRDISAQLHYVSVFKSLIPLLMCLVPFSPFSGTGCSSCCFLLTCSFIPVDKFHFHLSFAAFPSRCAGVTDVQQFSNWIASKYYQMPDLLISGKAA